jgi:hypothetical protein
MSDYKFVLPNLFISLPKQTQHVDAEVKYSACIVRCKEV